MEGLSVFQFAAWFFFQEEVRSEVEAADRILFEGRGSRTKLRSSRVLLPAFEGLARGRVNLRDSESIRWRSDIEIAFESLRAHSAG